jgi:hypothetical protein
MSELRRRWRLYGLIAVGLVAALGVFAYFGPRRVVAWGQDDGPPPMARAMLLVHAAQPSILRGSTPPTEQERAEFQKTQAALIKCGRILENVVKDPGVSMLTIIKQQSDPLDWLEKRLRVAFEGDVMSVWLTAGNPAERSTIVNKVVDAYMFEVVQRDKFARQEQRRLLERLQAGYQHRLEATRAELVKLIQEAEISAGAEDLQPTRGLLLGRQDACEKEMLALRLKRAGAEVRLEALKGEGSDEARRKARDIEVELAVIEAQRKVLDEEMARLQAQASLEAEQPKKNVKSDAALARLEEEIRTLTAASRKVGERIEELTADLEAPDRVLLLNHARVGRDE